MDERHSEAGGGEGDERGEIHVGRLTGLTLAESSSSLQAREDGDST